MKAVVRLLPIWLLYLIVAIVATYPLARQADDHVFGLGTPPLNVWAIAWVNHQLPREPLSLFDGNVFYPYPRSLAFSEHLFVPSLLASPWLVLTGNPVLAHNLTALLSLSLAGLFMYLLCLELTGDRLASFAGGALFAVHTWNVNELIRLQILSNQWFPLLLLTLLRFFRQPGGRTALAVGGVYALQSLSCMYWALYLPWVTGPAVAVLWWRRPLPARKLFPLAGALGAALLATALFALPYLRNAQEFGFQREEPSPIPIDRYLDVLPGNYLYATLLGTAHPNEDAAHFLGFAAMSLGLVGFLASRRGDRLGGLRGLFALFVVVGFLLSLGTELQLGSRRLAPGPYAFLYHFVPGFQSVRYPERFSLLVLLGLAPLVAAGLARLRESSGRLAVPALGAFVVIEHLSSPLPLHPLPPGGRVPEVYTSIAGDEDAKVVAEVPGSRYWGERADADLMYFATVHWKRTVQGFTGYFPPGYHFLRWQLFHFPAPESIDFLSRLGVDTVVVRPENGRLPDWAGPSPHWDVHGPFAEGHLALRLRQAEGLRFPAPGSEEADLVEVDPQKIRTHASTPEAPRARDGDPSTSWSTVEAQRRGDFYAIRFLEPVIPARVSLELGYPYELPMRLEVLGRLGPGRWIEIPYDRPTAYQRLFAELVHRPWEATFDLDLDPDLPPLEQVRLRIHETDPFMMPWTVGELRVYQRAR